MIGHLLMELRHDLASGASGDELVRHLDGIDAVMTTHFRYEEKRLLGVLDEIDLTDVDAATAWGPLG
jgi:hypothetical protein